MTIKQKMLLGAMALIVLTLFTIAELKKSPEPKPQMASMNFIQCTVAKFILNDIDSTKQIAPLFTGLGDLSYPISTEKKNTQIYFDQGLKLTYGFNHSEAHRSFLEASRLDKNAPMAYWGQAYTLGPNINDPFPDTERKLKSWEAIQNAKKLSAKVTPKEQALIEALEQRYSEDTTAETAALNMNYMKAMAKVADRFPNDDHILTLYAASIMNTVPWNYWDKNGKPSDNIPEAQAALEKAMKINPNNPGAHHYYIHMVELPQPDLAVPSADALGKLMPSAGHIVHMPSHIYIRVGRYLDAVKVNEKAILADEDYISECYAQGMYPLGYYPHNIHFLWSAASLLGDSELAIDAAKKTAEKVPVGELKALPFLQNFAATPLLAYVRFGRWNEILTTPSPNSEIKHLKLIWHYARGIAFTRKNNTKEAIEELEAIKSLIEDPEMLELFASGFDSSSVLAQVAHEVVAGEIALVQGAHKEAVTHLEKAVELEDNLVYTEPSAWYIPPRQNLGAALLATQNYSRAESVYREDLKKLRQNGWSLMGLHQSLKLQGKVEEAEKVLKEFKKAWLYADFEIESSVL
jgi:tetratricopeptide (TPR) repeat protein